MAGYAWQPAQLSRLKRGPRPSAVPSEETGRPALEGPRRGRGFWRKLSGFMNRLMFSLNPGSFDGSR